jgi:hypothetical protein
MSAVPTPPPRLALCDRCDYIADDRSVRQDGYTIDQLRAYGAACAAAERGRCAKLCEAQKVNKSPDYAPGNYFDGGCCACADAIRNMDQT